MVKKGSKKWPKAIWALEDDLLHVNNERKRPKNWWSDLRRSWPKYLNCCRVYRNRCRKSVGQILHESFDVCKVCVKTVSKLLATERKNSRTNIGSDILNDIVGDPGLSDEVIACDESWFFTYDSETNRCTRKTQKSKNKANAKSKSWRSFSLTFKKLSVFTRKSNGQPTLLRRGEVSRPLFVSEWDGEGLICGRTNPRRFVSAMRQPIPLCLQRRFSAKYGVATLARLSLIRGVRGDKIWEFGSGEGKSDGASRRADHLSLSSIALDSGKFGRSGVEIAKGGVRRRRWTKFF